MKWKISDNDIYKLLDKYFKKLDNTPFFPNSIFNSEEEKEKYETEIMFVFRKYQAAEYHYKNVLKYLEEDEKVEKKLEKVNEMEQIASNLTEYQSESGLTVEMPANHYIYELFAFLEALKSSIDFLAAILAKHIKGVQTDKVSTLIKKVKNRKKGPIFYQIRKHIKWLNDIIEYRHHLVHRLILKMARVYKKMKIYNENKIFLQPIYIPESPPKYVPDTRRYRLIGKKSGYKMPHIEIISKFGDKSVRTYFEYLQYKGYIPIKDFMKNHLNFFRNFFKDIIDVLTKIEFKQV